MRWHGGSAVSAIEGDLDGLLFYVSDLDWMLFADGVKDLSVKADPDEVEWTVYDKEAYMVVVKATWDGWERVAQLGATGDALVDCRLKYPEL